MIVHGLLHLVRYDDKSAALKVEMRKAEDQALELSEIQAWQKGLTQSLI